MQLYHKKLTLYNSSKAVDDLADRLNQILTQKGLKSADICKGTGITPPVMSRYLSGKSGASASNIFKLSQYLNVSADWLQNGSDAPELIKMPKSVSVDKDKIIEVQTELIKNLQKQIKEWEDWKATSKDRHARGKAKADLAIKKNKQKVGFLKKHKPKK